MKQYKVENLEVFFILVDFFYRRFRALPYACTPTLAKNDAYALNLPIPFTQM